MKYTILSAHTGIHGSLMNLLDLTDYLIRQGHDVDFVCMDRYYLSDNLLKQTVRKYKLGNIYDVNTVVYEKANILSGARIIRLNETVITDFKSLISWPKSIICEKLVILDNSELSYHLNNTVIDFYPKDIGDIRTVLEKHTYNDHIFCMPPSNFEQFTQRYPDLNARIFFKKINIEALCTARPSDNGKFFYRGDAPPKGLLKLAPEPVLLDDLTQMFKYSGYIYYRRRDRAAYEQLGRMIFEFIIFNKRVYFYDKPDSENDGLADYWRYYHNGDRDYIIEMMLEPYKDAPWE